tara:strand:+ start:4510 stop:5400 length:891 start_codon:yes stop_codon:yes gene_type:complete
MSIISSEPQYNHKVASKLLKMLSCRKPTENAQLQDIRTDLLEPIFKSACPDKSGKLVQRTGQRLAAMGNTSQPLIVRAKKFGGEFEVICGALIWLAAKNAGINSLSCLVARLDDDDAVYLSAMESILTKENTAIDCAHSFAQLSRIGLTHEEIGRLVGVSRTFVTNRLRLLTLPFAVQTLVENGDLSFALARPLCGLKSSRHQVLIAKAAIAQNLSAVEVAKKVVEHNSQKVSITSNPTTKITNIELLKKLIYEETGSACAVVKTDRGSWQLGLSFESDNDLLQLIGKLGVDLDKL